MKKRRAFIRKKKKSTGILAVIIIVILLLIFLFLIIGLGLKINGYNIFDGFVSLELPSGQMEKSVTGMVNFGDWIDRFRGFFGFREDEDKKYGMVLLGPGDNCTSISQYNITWYFDREYECGQFVNGDWWVVVNPTTGRVNVTRITPDFSGTRNGWEVNPSNIVQQGFDNRVNDFNLSLVPALPVLINPNSSIVKSISNPSGQCSYNPARQCFLITAAVLTVLDNVPQNNGATVFRPAYFGNNKTLYYTSDIHTEFLPSLASVSNAPTLSSVAAGLQRVQLDHKIDWSGRNMHPQDNMPDYGAEIGLRNEEAALRLMLNDPIQDKMPSLIYFVQSGIDIYGIAINGGKWPSNGGHGIGRKLPAIFAAYLLNNSAMKYAYQNIGTNTFQEDIEIYHNIFSNKTLFGQPGCPEATYWNVIRYDDAGGSKTCRDPYGYIDGGFRPGQSYDYLVFGNWKYTALSVHLIPGMKFFWSNSSVFLDYVDQRTNFGVWTQPDLCAPMDGVCVGGPNADNYCNTAGENSSVCFNNLPGNNGYCNSYCPVGYCNYSAYWLSRYGVTYGPDGQGGCIRDSNSVDGIGRLPGYHGTSKDGSNYRSLFGDNMWDTYRNLSSGGGCPSGYASNISQYNITWFFDGCYRVGQFVNGDWWVVGPVTVMNVTPAPTIINGTLRHGSMINPIGIPQQGYDGRASESYNSSLSVIFSRALYSNQSLVSTISHEQQISHQNLIGQDSHPGVALKTAAVLTVLGNVPPNNGATIFRPPYAGNQKSLFDANNLHRELLPSIQPTTGRVAVPQWTAPQGVDAALNYSRYFQRVWLDHVTDWVARYTNPTDNMPDYLRETYTIETDAALLIISNVSNKENLLINFVQHGIDNYGVTLNGFGSRELSKFPVIFAGIMLNNSGMKNVNYTGFREESQTYYGTGWTGANVLWRQKIGNEHEHVNYTFWDSIAIGAGCGCLMEGYRRSSGGWTWIGTALALRIMNANSIWNHSAFFDYVDRWANENDSAYYIDLRNFCLQRPPPCDSIELNYASRPGYKGDEFVTNMWNTYRYLYNDTQQNCTNGQTQLCPLQNGVCAGSLQTCTNNAWPGCTAQNYLQNNANYQTQETLCDNLDNDCDGTIDENCNPPNDNCFTSNSSWQNFPFVSQSGIFRAEFNATPMADNIDGVIGLSLGNANAYTNLAAIIRFNDNGIIDVRDGATYRADVSVPYTSGINYHFRLVVDVPLHRYNAYVKPQGSSEILLANNYAFRTEQNNIASLDNLASITSVGTHDICDLNAVSESAGICGDGNINLGEECDGNNLNSQTCSTLDYPAGGILSCSAACEFNYNGCSLMPTFSQFNGSTTNFSNVNINNVANATLEKTSFGKIELSGNVINFTRIDLNRYVFIEDKKIGIFVEGNNFIARLDVPASIWFYNIGFTQPIVKKDGVSCDNCSTVSYTNSIFIVSVRGFSNYTVEEGYSVPPSGTGGNGGGGSGGTTYQCNDGRDNDNDGKIDYPNDKGCLNGFDNSELDGDCDALWSCRDWSSCVEGKQTRTCRDLNNCGISDGKPSEERDCGAAEGGEGAEGGEETGVQITPALKNIIEKLKAFVGKVFSSTGKKSFLISFVVFTVLIIVLAITLMLNERRKRLSELEMKKEQKIKVEERLR